MQEFEKQIVLPGFESEGSDAPTDPAGVSMLIRDLVNRVEQLESEKAALQEILGMRVTPPEAATKRSTPRRSALVPVLDPPEPVSRHRSSLRRPLAPVSAELLTAPQSAPPTDAQPDPSGQAQDLRELLNTSTGATAPQPSKKSGRIRSRFRRQCRYYSMVRLHAILAGFCLAMGSIVGALAFALEFSLVYDAGLVIAALGLIYMLIVGCFWIGTRFAVTDDKNVVAIDSALRLRPAQSLLSNVFYWISRIFRAFAR